MTASCWNSPRCASKCCSCKVINQENHNLLPRMQVYRTCRERVNLQVSNCRQEIPHRRSQKRRAGSGRPGRICESEENTGLKTRHYNGADRAEIRRLRKASRRHRVAPTALKRKSGGPQKETNWGWRRERPRFENKPEVPRLSCNPYAGPPGKGGCAWTESPEGSADGRPAPFSARPFQNRICRSLMSFTVQILVEQKLVLTKLFGEVNGHELAEAGSAIRSHPGFNPAFSELIDCTGITNLDVSIQFLQNMASAQSIFNKGSKHIIVAPEDYLYGLARMTQVLAEQTKPNVVVVRTVAEAYKTLGIKQA